jgi:hypothetical protein
VKTWIVCLWLCRLVVAAGSFLVTAYGVYSYLGADFGRDTLAMGLFCALPMLSFPVFLLSFKSLRWSVRTHWILAAGYLAVYSVLDWRACSESGYCHGPMQTVLQTLTTRPVEAVFAVAVFNLTALGLQKNARFRS